MKNSTEELHLNQEQKALSTISAVKFYEDSIYSIDYNGEQYTPVKTIIENIGLSWQPQQKKLREGYKRWKCHSMVIVAKDSKSREMLCIPVRKIAAFLATIQANRVKKKFQEKLIQYQDECDEVLYNYWTKGKAINPRQATEPKKSITPVIVENAKATLELAKIFGLKGNQALFSTNKAIKNTTGIDCMNLLGINGLENKEKIQFFTPTEIGKQVGGISAMKVNKLLETKGYQKAIRGMKNKLVWVVTEKGNQYCQLLDVGKKHADGTPVVQIKWNIKAFDDVNL